MISNDYVESIIGPIPTLSDNMLATVKKHIVWKTHTKLSIIKNHRYGSSIHITLNLNDPNFRDNLIDAWNNDDRLLV